MESPLEAFLGHALEDFQLVNAKDGEEAPTHKYYRLLGAEQFVQFILGRPVTRDETPKLKRRR